MTKYMFQEFIRTSFVRSLLSGFYIGILSILLCCLFIGTALAVGPDLSGGITNFPVKSPVTLPSVGSDPFLGASQVLDRQAVSPGVNTLVQPGIVSGPVMGPVTVPDVSLPGGIPGMQEVTPPVGRASEEKNVSIASVGMSTTRVSVNSTGAQGNGHSAYPSISADGRFVAFASGASNLVPGDTGYWDVFVHDRQTGTTTRVSVSSTGTQSNDNSGDPSISADGLYVAFTSSAQNLIPGDTNGRADVFVHDRQTGTTTRVSVNSTGTQGDFNSWRPAISANGRYVAFISDATTLVPGDTNGRADVFVHDRQTGATTRVSVSSAGIQGDGFVEGSSTPSISADGRFVAFASGASNLVPGDTNNQKDVFVHDRQTGATTRVSVSSADDKSGGCWSSNSSPSLSVDCH